MLWWASLLVLIVLFSSQMNRNVRPHFDRVYVFTSSRKVRNVITDVSKRSWKQSFLLYYTDHDSEIEESIEQ